MVEATVVELPFYDRANARQKQQASGAGRPVKEPMGAGLSLRTSPVHEPLQQLRPTWSSVGEMPVATHIGNATAQRLAATRLGLADVSALARVTLKGPAATELLSRHEIAISERNYECHEIDANGIVVRTGRAEFFLEDGWRGQTVERLRQALTVPIPGLLPVWRQDISLLLTGSESKSLLSQVCSFNFRDSGDDLVMTQLAGEIGRASCRERV